MPVPREVSGANLSVQDYWEGDCSVTGTSNDQAVTGNACTEVQSTVTAPSPGNIGSVL